MEAKELQAKGEWGGDEGDGGEHLGEYSHPAAPSIASQHLARNSLSLHSTGLGPTFTHRSNNLAAGKKRCIAAPFTLAVAFTALAFAPLSRIAATT